MVNFNEHMVAAERWSKMRSSVLFALKHSAGLSPREVRYVLVPDFPEKAPSIQEVLRAMSDLAGDGHIREADESGVFEYCGGLPK